MSHISLSPQEQHQQLYEQQLGVGKAQVGPKLAAPSPSAAQAEKLKRGLTNFMNQLNAGPFFVPVPMRPTSGQQQKGAVKANQSVVGSQIAAEPATIVNGDPTAEALIKGPNRLAQTRPIGGPLRWGRR